MGGGAAGLHRGALEEDDKQLPGALLDQVLSLVDHHPQVGDDAGGDLLVLHHQQHGVQGVQLTEGG